MSSRGYELEINPTNTCRTCLSQYNELNNIFCKEIVDGEIVPFPMILEECCEIQVSVFFYSLSIEIYSQLIYYRYQTMTNYHKRFAQIVKRR